jgi:hypothetical protein
MKIFNRFFKHINHKWGKFIKKVKQAADPDDHSQIFIDNFIAVLKSFKIDLSEEDK